MLNLNYILCGKLPEEERRYLEENLKHSECRILQIGPGVQDLISGRLPTEECILISGDAKELLGARLCKMATLGYLASNGSGEPQADMYAEGLEEVDYTFLLRVWQRHHHLPWTILTTARCIVKEFSMDYLDALFELYAGEGMTDYVAPLYPYEQEREYQQSYIEYMYGFYGYGMWIVCEKDSGRLIGRAGVECREELGGEPELGYVIGVPYQRQGYATEVCTAILAYARDELALPFLNCLIEDGNHVSEHVAERLGFSFVGELLLDGKRMKKYRYRLF